MRFSFLTLPGVRSWSPIQFPESLKQCTAVIYDSIKNFLKSFRSTSMECLSYSSDGEFDQLSERFESYSQSADVSESESSSNFSSRQHDNEGGASSSLASSPLAGLSFDENSVLPAPVPSMLPVIGGRDIVIQATKTESPEADFSGESCI